MSFDTAKACILREVATVKNDDRFNFLEIDLMGGEPLMNFPLIKRLVEWSENEGLIDVPHIFFVTSNGTLFNDIKIKEWFSLHRSSICVGVSWDGTTGMQTTNRGRCDIDFSYFHKNWPKQGFHMTISRETLPHLSEGVLEIQGKGYPLTAALASGVPFTGEDAVEWNRQLQILSDKFIANKSLPPLFLLDRIINIPDNIEELSAPQRKYCGTGSHMITYDVDGKAYGCHMFTPLVMGDKACELDRFDWEKCCVNNEDPYCRECVLKHICPSCAGFNLRCRGGIEQRDHTMCKMELVRALRSCEYQIKLILDRRTELDDDDAKHAYAAQKAYHVLKKLEPADMNDPKQYHPGPYLLAN